MIGLVIIEIDGPLTTWPTITTIPGVPVTIVDWKRVGDERDYADNLVKRLDGQLSHLAGVPAPEVIEAATRIKESIGEIWNPDPLAGMLKRLEAITTQYDAIDMEDAGFRNRMGINVHGRLQRLKKDAEAAEVYEDPVFNEPFRALVDRLLTEVFGLEAM